MHEEATNRVVEDCERLGFAVTKEVIVGYITDMWRLHPDKFKITGKGEEQRIHLTGIQIDDAWLTHMEGVYNTLKAEIGATLFKAIPREKNKYCRGWLEGSVIASKNDATIEEFYKAGRCYAYGENTACVFHLMRITEFYLTKVAQSLQSGFDPINWGAIAQLITKKMEEKYQNKTVDWKSVEPFYAGILCDIQALSRAHRNSALHNLNRTYDETEARKMLDVVEDLAKHVAEKL